MPDAGAVRGKIVAIPEGVPVEDGSARTAEAWRLLREDRDDLHLPELEVVALHRFPGEAEMRRLDPEEKARIVDQALLIFEHLYPHLPFKKERFPFAHPAETLREIRGRLSELGEPPGREHLQHPLVFP